MVSYATEKQIDLIKSLINERDIEDVENYTTLVQHHFAQRDKPEAYAAGVMLKAARGIWRKGYFTPDVASQVIDKLMAAPRKPITATCPVPPPRHREIADGRYALVEHGQTNFYRVTTSESGRQHVRLYVSDAQYSVYRGMAEKVLDAIEADPKSASLLYGREIGSCGLCGRTLTDESSRATGIGPVCAKKAGW